MKLCDISPGHIARNKCIPSFILLVGVHQSMCISGKNTTIFDNNLMHDDYEDLGEFKIKVTDKIVTTVKLDIIPSQNE